MILYTVFNKIDGRVEMVGTLTENEQERLNRSGVPFVQGEYDKNHYYKNGVVKKIPPRLPDEKFFHFNTNTEAWENRYSKEQQEELLVKFIKDIKKQRNQKLAETDWTQLKDVKFSTKEAKAWKEYRQALRDFPETILSPYQEVIWPIPPNEK